jgi:predicted nucleotidyltransferase
LTPAYGAGTLAPSGAVFRGIQDYGEAMKTLDEIKAILIEHKQEINERFLVRQISIFGSRARGEDTSISDVDILVELKQPVGWEIVDLHLYLEQLLNIKVDLVTQGAVIRKPRLWQSIQKDLIRV